MIRLIETREDQKSCECTLCGITFELGPNGKVHCLASLQNENYEPWEVCPDCAKVEDAQEVFFKLRRRMVALKERAAQFKEASEYVLKDMDEDNYSICDNGEA